MSNELSLSTNNERIWNKVVKLSDFRSLKLSHYEKVIQEIKIILEKKLKRIYIASSVFGEIDKIFWKFHVNCGNSIGRRLLLKLYSYNI